MINRQNWKDINNFLSHHAGTLQNDVMTVKRMRIALNHLLNWADEKPLGSVRTLTPTFPAYLASHTTKAGKGLASSGGEKNLSIARQFFKYARSEWMNEYKNISQNWIATLIPSKRNSSNSRMKDHKHYSLETVLKIADLWDTAETLEVKRDIAAVCFLFLSGMRISAFTSLPLDCVNIADNEIYQFPEKGVMTKNSKAAKTNLMQLPELLSIVTAWDDLVRSKLSSGDLWYPVLERGKDEFISGKKAGINRAANFGERLQVICNRAGVPYLSAHKLRHGHIVFGLKNSKDMAGFKSVSQNVMHSSLQITDSIYGDLSSADVKRAISQIGIDQSKQADPDPAQAAAPDMQAIIKALTILKDNPDLMNSLANAGKPTPTKKGKGK
jgi:integrase